MIVLLWFRGSCGGCGFLGFVWLDVMEGVGLEWGFRVGGMSRDLWR